MWNVTGRSATVGDDDWRGVKKIFTLSSLGQQRGRTAGNSLVLGSVWVSAVTQTPTVTGQPNKAASAGHCWRHHVGQTLAINPTF